MHTEKRTMAIFLLLLSGLLLSSLIPGGPIENRDFSHINPAILLSFNIVLTVLGLGSFALIGLLWKNLRSAWTLSAIAAFTYLVVYGIDLAALFPQSPTPMSAALYWIEVAGFIAAIPLLIISLISVRSRSPEHVSSQSNTNTRNKKSNWVIPGSIGIIALLIIGFATWSAMTPG